MALQFTTSYLEDCLALFRQYKGLAEQAMEQITDEQLFATLDPESNSIAIIVKHLAGNMRSRWTDFLTTDGEKPDRRRDMEFIDPPSTRRDLLEAWEDGWKRLLETLESLSEADLKRIDYDPWRGPFCHAGRQSPGRALRTSCRADRTPGQAFRRKRVEGGQRSSGSISGIQPPGGLRRAKPEIMTTEIIPKIRTATLLVPLHRIPPPKESMKMFRGESPPVDEHSGFEEISYGS